MKSAARRVLDRRVLHLLKMWLVARLKRKTSGAARNVRRSTATPGRVFRKVLLFHRCFQICARRFVLGWKRAGMEQRLGARIVNWSSGASEKTLKRR